MKVPPVGRAALPLSLKLPKKEQDENNYQDRPQDTAGAIPPALAMWPGRESPYEQNNDNDEHNQSHFHLLLPHSRRATGV
jgi:hypothetical protein